MESHLGLMKELSWVLQMAPLMVIIKAKQMVPCLEIDLDKKLVLYLVLLMVLWTEILMVCCKKQHSGSHLVHLMVLCLALMKASYSTLLMVNCLVLHFEVQMASHFDLIM